ncbi:uncharacterized protein LOC124541368 [Vanessa cardui]|uniref:uncharacterized protein LOC124541368 n=1 Tax=Vanessa cardui TaxID=171605 RepID=UPI001F13ABC2|nr:uncharacterized protein LOC124541368 [Vanessa cardui]
MCPWNLCVDEQICSTKARHNLKRYNPKKPNKWGYKIYVLSGVSGFAYKFEPETGTENKVEPGEPDLGAASNVVDKEISKKDRGYSIEYVGSIEGTEISTVAWKDNKIVTLASSFVGELPKAQVSRYDKLYAKTKMVIGLCGLRKGSGVNILNVEA